MDWPHLSCTDSQYMYPRVTGAARHQKIRGWVGSKGPIPTVPLWSKLLEELGNPRWTVQWLRFPCTLPPPLVLPHPLSFPGGGGGSLGQHKSFCYGSLCCCVGDCAVRHCHLYSWQDILLPFAERELDSTTMLTPGTNVMFIHSMGEPVFAQVIGYSEHGDAYCRIYYECEPKMLYSVVLQCKSVPENVRVPW